MRVGIVSDTHGLLRAEVLERFAGVDHILHAGDVGSVDILIELEAIAPVTAVWGNVDGWEVRDRLPEVAGVELAGARVVVQHGQQHGSPTPEKLAAAHPGADLVVFGHSHRPLIRSVGSTLCVNPGSAGPVRFRQRPFVALAQVEDRRVEARLVALDPARK